MTKVIIVDDHKMFRIGLKYTFQLSCPEIEVTGEAGSGEELFLVLENTPADLILLDINLPGMSGVDIVTRLHQDYPEIKILVISAENSAESVLPMISAGINGFVGKESGDVEELFKAIQTVMSGLEYYNRDISSILFSVYVSKKETTNVTDEFSEREREIILLCKEGLMCKEISDRIGLSINTINTHKKKIFKKLGINTTLEMVQYALKKGIIQINN